MNANSLQRSAFRASISVKGFDGVLETLGGVLLWFVRPSSLTWMRTFWFREFARHPHNFVAFHMLNVSQRLVSSDPAFASFYLLSHGLIKVVLAIALFMNELWAYPLAISVFSAFCVYQVYRYTYTHSEGLLWLTVFDIAVVMLTWREYRLEASARKVAGVPASE